MNNETTRIIQISLERITPNPEQPRKVFRPEALRTLANSIKESGVQTPVKVRPNPNKSGHYILIFGERRWRASKMAGMNTIPCIVMRGEQDSAKAALIENFQREDLNPVDGGEAFLSYKKEHGFTIAQMSAMTGKSTATIQNWIKLLELPEEIREMVRHDELPSGSALRIIRHVSKGQRAMMQMARDLIDGKSELEAGVLDLEPNKRSKDKAFGRMARRPENMMTRILRYFGWSSMSILTIVDDFFRLSERDRNAYWFKMPASSRENFLKRIVGIRDAAERLYEFFAGKSMPARRQIRAEIRVGLAVSRVAVAAEPKTLAPPARGHPEKVAQARPKPVSVVIEELDDDTSGSNLPAMSEEILSFMFGISKKRDEATWHLNFKVDEFMEKFEVPTRELALSKMAFVLGAMRDRWGVNPSKCVDAERPFILMIGSIESHFRFTSCYDLFDWLRGIERGKGIEEILAYLR